MTLCLVALTIPIIGTCPLSQPRPPRPTAYELTSYRAVSFVAPFGGYKKSGLGRESGQAAIEDWMQTKAVWISTSTETPNPFVLR